MISQNEMCQPHSASNYHDDDDAQEENQHSNPTSCRRVVWEWLTLKSKNVSRVFFVLRRSPFVFSGSCERFLEGWWVVCVPSLLCQCMWCDTAPTKRKRNGLIVFSSVTDVVVVAAVD